MRFKASEFINLVQQAIDRSGNPDIEIEIGNMDGYVDPIRWVNLRWVDEADGEYAVSRDDIEIYATPVQKILILEGQ